MSKKEKLQIIPLGGLGEVGKNMTLLRWKKNILIIDMGLMFPEETTPGIDFIIPNINYLEDKKKEIKGVVFTHGHYDHIGAIPYLTDKLGSDYPMYAGPLAKEIILKRQKEFPHKGKLDLRSIKDGQKEKIGPFEIEFVRMNHNIPDTFGFLIKTPVGNIFHTADFKFDTQPMFDKPTDFEKLKRIGEQNILLLMCDATGAEEEGSSLSEKEIMDNLEKIFKEAEGRIIASTFASLLNRVQQLIVLSQKHGRKIAIEGRSMRQNVEIAQKLGYLKIKKGSRIQTRHLSRYPDSKVTVICTGAQGEERAALTRIARGEHRHLKFKDNDTVILSSSVVPGNEVAVQELKDSILRNGPEVYHYQMMDIHASGHAKQEELIRMLKMIKPEFLIPVHGQYSMLKKLTGLASQAGIPKNKAKVVENGDLVELTPESISVKKKKVKTGYVLVDGLGVGDVGKIVLRDREILAEDGIFVVIAVLDRNTGKIQNSPDIISRGFVYLRESKDLLSETRKKVESIVKKAAKGKMVDERSLKKEIREKIASYLYSKTERRPMVLPVIIKV